MTFKLSFPQIVRGGIIVNDGPSLEPGQVLFILGANGAGKSRLVHHFYKTHTSVADRISAHRQSFLSSSGGDLTPQGRTQMGDSVRSWNSQANAAWLEHSPEARANIAIFDILEAENTRARMIANAVDVKDIGEAQAISLRNEPPLRVINELFQLSNLPILVSADGRGGLKATRRASSPYGVNRLSDGERNALLLAASVLTAKPGRLILIDEPERHLHRSIISPLLTHLFERRKDCAFVVSTHDVTLATDNPKAKLLLLRSASFQGEEPHSWDADLLENTSAIDESFKYEILGARRQVIFVEGTSKSLDNRLYNLLFEGASVLPKETAKDVTHAVTSINGTSDMHWVHAFGIIDLDTRTADDVSSLAAKKIFALPVYSIEALYYSEEIVKAIAKRKSVSEGINETESVGTAIGGALDAVSKSKEHLARRRVEMELRHDVLGKLPTHKALTDEPTFNYAFDIERALKAELDTIDRLVSYRDLQAILARYPVRETNALGAISKSLRFLSTQDYETAVIAALIDDAALLKTMRASFTNLITAIAESIGKGSPTATDPQS